MVLFGNIGNRRFSVAVYSDERKKLASFRLYTDKTKSSLEYQESLAQFFSFYGIDPKAIGGGLLSSVVPSMTHRILEAMEKLTQAKIFLLDRSVKTGLAIRQDSPSEVGSDLLALAVGAVDDYRTDVFIAYFSACTCFLVADRESEFLGGAIGPGLAESAEETFTENALLREVPLGPVRRYIGKNTEESLNAGLIGGFSAMAEGMADRMEKEAGRPLLRILTGPAAKVLATPLSESFVYAPDLLFDGMYDILERTRKEKEKKHEPSKK